MTLTPLLFKICGKEEFFKLICQPLGRNFAVFHPQNLLDKNHNIHVVLWTSLECPVYGSLAAYFPHSVMIAFFIRSFKNLENILIRYWEIIIELSLNKTRETSRQNAAREVNKQNKLGLSSTTMGRTLSGRMDHLVCQYSLKHEYVTAARGPPRCHVVRPATLV